MTFLLPVVSREVCQERLEMIFPREGLDSSMSNLLAATAVAGMIYVGAVTPEYSDALEVGWRYVRPTSVLWFNDEVFKLRAADADRNAWWEADKVASVARRRTKALMETWNVSTEQWYENNNREGLRDETFRHWRTQGAVLERTDLDTTSSQGRWILRRSFAELFNPDLQADELAEAIELWSQQNMSTSGKMKASLARARTRGATSVEVTLPDGTHRALNPGNSSLLIKGVIEGWAALRLESPMVLTISESGDKIFLADAARLAEIGIHISVSRLLPDALIVNLGDDVTEFWIIEVVATDGPITEERKGKFLSWAESQGIPPESCRFLTAFLSRNDPAAKKQLKHLAAGTYAWFLDEPEYELSWNEIESAIPDNVTELGMRR